MGSKMRVVIASRGSGLPTDATDVRLFPGVHLRREEWFFVFPLLQPWQGSFIIQLSSVMDYLEMVRQIVTSGELLMTVLALVIPTTRKIRQASRLIKNHLRMQQISHRVPVCSATCRCQLLLTVNWSPHSLQTKGFTPRCDRMCCSSKASRRYACEKSLKRQSEIDETLKSCWKRDNWL